MWTVANDKFSNTDINFYDIGYEQCANGYHFGPAVRDHYIIHYVLSGKGIYQYGKKTYHLKAGDGFLICPDYVTYYQADTENPWSYTWVGFIGIKAPKIIKQSGLSQDNPIFTYTKDSFFKDMIKNIADYNKYSLESELIRDSYLYLFLAKLISISPNNSMAVDHYSSVEEYVKSSIDYIERNYSKNISVNEISNYIGVNRTYFSHIFKKLMCKAPIEYIVETRMDKACTLLKNPTLKIAEVSASVGYPDQFVFSKQFKKIMGISPSQYRKANT